MTDFLGDDFLLNRTENSGTMLVAVKQLQSGATSQMRYVLCPSTWKADV